MKLSTQLLFTTLSKTTKQVSVFALSIILARYFTKTDYGTYLHVQLIANIAIWALLLGIPHSVYYFFQKTYEKRRFIYTTLALIMSIAVTVSLLVFFNIANLSRLLANPNVLGLSVIISLLIFLQIPLSIFEPLMIASKKVQKFVIVDFIFNIGFFAALVTPIMLGRDVIGILYWMVGFFVLQFVTVMLVCIQVALSYDNQKPKEEVATGIEQTEYSIKDQFKYSLPIGGSLSLREVSRYADKIIVSNQFSPDDFAVYARGAMDVPVISIVANTLDNLLMPKFIEAYHQNNTDEIIKVWHSAMRVMAAFIYPTCLFLIFIGPWLIPALFSEKYNDSVIIFQIYTLGMLTKISTFNVIFRAMGKTQAMLWISLASLFMNIVLTYTLIQLYGVKGAAISVLLLTLFYLSSCLVVIARNLNINLKQVLPWKSLAVTLAISAISTMVVSLFSAIDVTPWTKIIVLSVIFSICYLALFKYTPALSANEKDTIRSFFPKKLKWLI